MSRRALTLRDICHLSRDILYQANRGSNTYEFFTQLTEKLQSFLSCSALELRLTGPDGTFLWHSKRGEKGQFEHSYEEVKPGRGEETPFDTFCWSLLAGNAHLTTPGEFIQGSICHGDTAKPLCYSSDEGNELCITVGGPWGSFATTRFVVDEKRTGLLVLKDEELDFFSEEDIELYEGLAQVLGLALADRNAHAELRERVKELTCLYGIAREIESGDLLSDSIFERVIALLPRAMQFPDHCAARLTLEEQSFDAGDFEGVKYILSTGVFVGDCSVGKLEVGYDQLPPGYQERPFLSEEESLIDAVAREIAHIRVRRESELDRERLQEQLRHADRLATIGQLAAGVAHELNEPLGSILGFAQLIQRSEELSLQGKRDLERIVSGALYSREVIRKLMLFARQMPPQQLALDIDKIVKEGLDFFEARCAKNGIELVKNLSDRPKTFWGDPAQVRQVLVNLVVNAVQAMPEGGSLEVSTEAKEDSVILKVSDSGIGMSDEVKRSIFLPFYTTKDVDEGTGLGLAVVHGIVRAHRGEIVVDSTPGEGSCFIVRFPSRKRDVKNEES